MSRPRERRQAAAQKRTPLGTHWLDGVPYALTSTPVQAKHQVPQDDDDSEQFEWQDAEDEDDDEPDADSR